MSFSSIKSVAEFGTAELGADTPPGPELLVEYRRALTTTMLLSTTALGDLDNPSILVGLDQPQHTRLNCDCDGDGRDM